MERSRRLRLAAATAPVQFGLSVLLALLFAQLAEGSSGEWADLVGVVIGMVLGPCLGAAVMIFLAQRARSIPAARALLAGAAGAVSAFVATVVLFGLGVHPFAAIAIVFALSTAVVWVLSGST
jgi:hypothetical protein